VAAALTACSSTPPAPSSVQPVPASQAVLATRRGGWSVDCIDSGPGVDPADQDRIFNPFYQGVRQPSSARKGSGIGLSIVKELVEAHGGQVSLVHRNGATGAHFHIEIPDAPD
ncbi:MAG: ATP-binding protein, partial [Betaproteobacteria bacterium]|nr:ATP-binding protein [Betaproteobacteria bacterium]